MPSAFSHNIDNLIKYEEGYKKVRTLVDDICRYTNERNSLSVKLKPLLKKIMNLRNEYSNDILKEHSLYNIHLNELYLTNSKIKYVEKNLKKMIVFYLEARLVVYQRIF